MLSWIESALLSDIGNRMMEDYACEVERMVLEGGALD
jgi:hypothetical protein